MKIVIADDEPLVRISLVSMIREMDTDWEIVGEAAQGEEMLELLRRHQPEAAVVDIRMPLLDGIEAIRLGKEISPQTRWIILSGFSDFEYAQQALRLGVDEYLLKPVVPEDLEKALHSVSLRNQKYASLLNSQFENRFISLVHGHTLLAAEPEDSLLRTGHYQALVFCFDSPLAGREREAAKCGFIDTLRRLMPDHLVHGAHLALFALNGCDYASAGVWSPEREEARRAVETFFHCAVEAASRVRNDQLAVTAVLSDVCDHYEMFMRQLQLMQQCAGIRVICGIDRTWPFRDIQRHAEAGEWLQLGRSFLQLADDCRSRQYLNYQHTLDDINIRLTRSLGPKLTCGMRRNIREYIRRALGAALPDAGWESWIGELKEWGEKWLREHVGAAEPQDLVAQMLQYIEQHYMNNIGLNQIADELKVTPSYLSTLFHKKTGTTFVKYLTRLRMLKAQELLTGTNLQVKQIAERVGYYSTRYFTRLFVDTFGEYPSDFRKKARGEKHVGQ